jgi:hypothetical protein
MEQALLDSSKYKISTMSVDSRFADNVYCGSTDYMIRLPSPLRNVQRVAIASAEVPLVEYLFSAAHGNLNFTIKRGTDATVAGSLPAGNYTDTEFVSALQTALNTAAPPGGFVVNLSTTTGLLKITNPAVPTFEFNGVSDNPTIEERRTHWGIGYYMGFRTKTTRVATSGTTGITCTSPLLIQPTPYYLIQVGIPDTINSLTHLAGESTSVAAMAKLVLRNNVYVLQFVDNADRIRKEFTFLSPVNVSQLRIKLVDPYGALVDLLDMDWSLTFELYEVVNSRTYNHLGQGFER